jgi:hypothetical protein
VCSSSGSHANILGLRCVTCVMSMSCLLVDARSYSTNLSSLAIVLYSVALPLVRLQVGSCPVYLDEIRNNEEREEYSIAACVFCSCTISSTSMWLNAKMSPSFFLVVSSSSLFLINSNSTASRQATRGISVELVRSFELLSL